MLSYSLFGLPATGFDSSAFFTSWLLPPLALACLRALLSAYAFSTIFYSFGWFAHHVDIFHLKDVNLPEITFSLGASAIAKSFSYFTYLAYWGQAFYFAISALHGFVYHYRQRQLWRRHSHHSNSYNNHQTWLDAWPRWLQVAHSIFYTSVICFPPMVSAIYWASMFVDRWYTLEFDQWSNVSIHMLNTIFALCEITLPRTPIPPWSHLGVLMACMSLYLGLVYISKAVEDFYPYLWLDPSVGWRQIVAHVLGYTMAIVLVYNVVLGLVWLRRSYTEPSCKDGSTSRASSNRSRQQQDEDDEIPLTRPRDLEMASTARHHREAWGYNFSRPQTGVSVPETVYSSAAASTFDFGFGDGSGASGGGGGGGDVYSLGDSRRNEAWSPQSPADTTPVTPRLQLRRDERGYWSLA